MAGNTLVLTDANFESEVLASDKPVAGNAIAAELQRLDMAGTPREVTERVAELAARQSGAAHWGARAIRY